MAHLLIGLLVVAVTKAFFKQKLAVPIVVGLLALAAHHELEAPVARKLSALGM
jgi:hypothetical protein